MSEITKGNIPHAIMYLDEIRNGLEKIHNGLYINELNSLLYENHETNNSDIKPINLDSVLMWP